jgi:hypothetical protein
LRLLHIALHKQSKAAAALSVGVRIAADCSADAGPQQKTLGTLRIGQRIKRKIWLHLASSSLYSMLGGLRRLNADYDGSFHFVLC